ncbi:hypothetical protein NPIL_568441 [Nephila pilipes]|uniref:Uncharacterized protein n=1 Tax=Nephila pilipes TaxID=299642 RepID=A0A8X6UBM2_NEPPI|nr:hypothetical protein NPIL_568441 [Nephila pilipes]
MDPRVSANTVMLGILSVARTNQGATSASLLPIKQTLPHVLATINELEPSILYPSSSRQSILDQVAQLVPLAAVGRPTFTAFLFGTGEFEDEDLQAAAEGGMEQCCRPLDRVRQTKLYLLALGLDTMDADGGLDQMAQTVGFPVRRPLAKHDFETLVCAICLQTMQAEKQSVDVFHLHCLLTHMNTTIPADL